MLITLREYREYPSDECSITVKGTTNFPLCICYDHHMEGFGEGCIWIDAGDGVDRKDVNISNIKNAQKLFNHAVWDKETDTFSVKQFFDLVRQGKNPFIEI